MSDEIKQLSPYEECCSGPFSPFRDRATRFGWGIRHQPTGTIFGYIGDKSCAFGVAAALNHKWEAAHIFLEHSNNMPDDYFINGSMLKGKQNERRN